MKRVFEERGASFWVSVVGLLAAIAIVASLCALALRASRRASVLTEATRLAESAAAVFYASDTAEELAELLDAKTEDGVTFAVGGELVVTLSEKEYPLIRAEITVTLSDETVYTLSCLKLSPERMA